MSLTLRRGVDTNRLVVLRAVTGDQRSIQPGSAATTVQVFLCLHDRTAVRSLFNVMI